MGRQMLRCCRLATIPVDRFGVRDDNAVDAAALGDAMSRFSDRYGYKGEKSPIIVREDAPAALREAVPTIAEDCGIDPRHLRRVVCHVLRRIPDPNNWSPHPNMWEEAVQHVQDCAWYRVYDICEALYDFLLTTRQDEDAAERLQTQLNDVFVEHGIGWQMAEGAMLARESEAIDSAVQAAEERLQETGSTTARDELREALLVADRLLGLSPYWDSASHHDPRAKGASSIIYDGVAPVFAPHQVRDYSVFLEQLREIREKVFDPEVLQNREEMLRFWGQVHDGLGEGVLHDGNGRP